MLRDSDCCPSGFGKHAGCASASVVSIAEVAAPSESNPVEVEREEPPASIRASSRSPSRDGRIPGLELLRLRFDANGPMPDRLLDFLGEERGTPDGLGLLQQRMDELEARALVATLGPPRAAIESSLGEVLSFEPLFAEVAARKRRAVIVNGRPRLVEGGRLALELRGWIRLHEDGPRVAGELELAHRSGPAFRPVQRARPFFIRVGGRRGVVDCPRQCTRCELRPRACGGGGGSGRPAFAGGG